MKVIFLDIDGVLNNYDTLGPLGLGWEPSLVKILKRIVKETEAKIVLSSAWRILKNNCRIITDDMKIGFIDKTPQDFKTRGSEIQGWLDNNPRVDRFVILDDASDMEHLMPHLLQTDGEFGLTDEIADEAIKRLNRLTMLNKFLIDDNIDWSLLRKQKLSLLEIIAPRYGESELSVEVENHLSGIIGLIDNVQDSAVESGKWTEKEVFD